MIINNMKKTFGISIILAASFTFAANAQNVVTFEEAADPVALTAAQEAQWDEVGDDLNAAWRFGLRLPEKRRSDCSVLGTATSDSLEGRARICPCHDVELRG